MKLTPITGAAAVMTVAAGLALATPAIVAGAGTTVASTPTATPLTPRGLTLSIATLSPIDITRSGATLRANVLAIAGASVIGYEYGTTTGYGQSAGEAPIPLLGTLLQASVPVTDLQPDTLYHARPYLQVGNSRVLVGTDTVFRTLANVAEPVTETTGLPPVLPPVGDDQGQDGDDQGQNQGATTATTTTPTVVPVTPTTAHPPLAAAPAAAPTPTRGESVVVAPVSGEIRVRDERGDYRPLADNAAIPVGSIVDARHGRLELTSVRDPSGRLQTGRFWGGVFQVRQGQGTGGRTELVLRGGSFTGCSTAAARRTASTSTAVAGHAAAKKRKPRHAKQRRLWGSDSGGSFQTRGRGSVATVRGTRWLTVDTCAGTRTTVVEGAVAVRNLRTGRTKLVRAGQSHLVRVGRG